MKELAAKYSAKDVEDKWYAWWLEHKFFHSEPNDKEPYTIVIPPPNVTGILHMGHVLNNTLNDVLIRKARMDGKNACWVPGTDHASIATESKVVARLKEQGIRKEDIGREEFLRHAWEWKEEHGGIILQQLRKLGCSCDWDRTRFTMEPALSEAVINTFVYFYKKGWIYKGVRMVNWDPEALTAVSDDEVVHKDTQSHFYHLKYYISDGQGKPTDQYLVIATTRPETIMADAAICVNPADERHHWLRGKKVLIPLINKEIPVIEDSYVEMDFGTGCLKVTPAHDVHDYEIGLRHNLPVVEIIDDHGKLNEKAQILVGEDRFVARKKIVKMLEEAGNLVKVEDYTSPVGYSERTDAVIEPKLSAQWFLKMDQLAQMALETVESGRTQFIPEKYVNTYRHWMENARDWCISRQLWWGQRIPAYYLPDGSYVVEATPEAALKSAQAINPAIRAEDLKYFYPTSMLVTGYDIITFWVSRMIFSGIENMGETPFETVLIHGLVRDELGRKMSKSLGNGVDPLEVVEEYGADALRFSLVMGVSPGNDTRYSRDKVEAARNFANKVWNASRFVLMNVNERKAFDPAKLETADKWILTRLQEAVKDISDHMEEGDFGLAATKIYDFAWSEFCDWYIELSKSRLLGEDGESKETVKAVLLFVLENLLKLLHPFMPFLTEQVYKYLPDSEGFLMLQRWPEYRKDYVFNEDEQKMQGVMEIIRTIRNLRSEMNVAPSKRTHLMLLPAEGWAETLLEGEGYFKKLAGAEQVQLISDRSEATGKNVSAVVTAGELFIPLGDLVDFEKETARLTKELENLKKEMARSEGMLKNPGFLSKAPAQLVQGEKDKLEAAKAKAAALENRIAELKESM